MYDGDAALVGQSFGQLDLGQLLFDLSNFGIYVHDQHPQERCFHCTGSTRGYSEGYGLDDCCENCHEIFGWNFANLYTIQTMRVSPPLTFSPNVVEVIHGVARPYHYDAILALVMIGGQPYIAKSTSVALCPLYDLTGKMVTRYGLHLGRHVLEDLLLIQPAWPV